MVQRQASPFAAAYHVRLERGTLPTRAKLAMNQPEANKPKPEVKKPEAEKPKPDKEAAKKGTKIKNNFMSMFMIKSRVNSRYPSMRMLLLKKRKACRLDICFTLEFKVDIHSIYNFYALRIASLPN